MSNIKYHKSCSIYHRSNIYTIYVYLCNIADSKVKVEKGPYVHLISPPVLGEYRSYLLYHSSKHASWQPFSLDPKGAPVGTGMSL